MVLCSDPKACVAPGGLCFKRADRLELVHSCYGEYVVCFLRCVIEWIVRPSKHQSFWLMMFGPGALGVLFGWFCVWLLIILTHHQQENHHHHHRSSCSSCVEGWQPLYPRRGPTTGWPSGPAHRKGAPVVAHETPLYLSRGGGRHGGGDRDGDGDGDGDHDDDLIPGATNAVQLSPTAAGASWIRLPMVIDLSSRDFTATATLLERLLEQMFIIDGRSSSRSDSVEDTNIIVVGVPATTNPADDDVLGTTSSSGGGTTPPPPGSSRSTSSPDQVVAWSWSCVLPAAMDHAQVSVQWLAGTNLLVLSLNATDSQDFGWVCSQFYSQREQLTQIGMDCEGSLRKIVALFFNKLPPERGVSALTSAWCETEQHQFVKCLNGRSLVQTLDATGFIVMDGAMDIGSTLPPQQDLFDSLESLLLERTDQGDLVRTDRVRFVSAQMASACGLGSANTFLRGIAHYLNQEQQQTERSSTTLGITTSNHEETEELLLTLPDRLQFAEYGHQDFYKVSTVFVCVWLLYMYCYCCVFWQEYF
jgi:hypothetical protein